MAKRNQMNNKIIAGTSIAIAVTVVVVLFLPMSVLGFTDERSLKEIILNAQEEIQQVSGLEIPFCDEPSECQGLLFIVENRTLFENIIDPIKDGVQDQDPNIIVIENSTIKVDNGIIIEQNPPAPPAPEQISIQLVSKIIKTDNNGTVTESKTNTDIPFLLSFFVEDTSNLDFDNGFLEQTLQLKTKPDVMIITKAEFNIFIDKKPIFENPIILSVEGKSDSNGEIDLDFLPTPTIKSKSYLFAFKDNIEKFNPNGLSKAEFIISNISIQANEQNFVLTNSTIYSMDIVRDQIKILIKNESGGITRVYPTDDILSIISSQRSWSYTQGFGCKSIGCGSYVTFPRCVVAPPMGGGTIVHIKKDGTNDLINTFPPTTYGTSVATNAGWGQACYPVAKISMNIQRDEIYKINFFDPVGSVTFKTPKDKKTDYSFYCSNVSDSGLTIVCNYKNQAVIDSLTASLGQ